MLAGVKVSMDGEIFVSIPRWKNANGGVPATLNKIVVTEENVTLLEPYPSWEMNQVRSWRWKFLISIDWKSWCIAKCLGIRSGSTKSTLGSRSRKSRSKSGHSRYQGLDPFVLIIGSIKLLIFDLNTDKLIQSYYFSELEAPLNNSFMNDLVIDKYNGFAYITGIFGWSTMIDRLDTGLGADVVHAGLVVYDFNKNIARRVLNQVSWSRWASQVV